MRAYHRWISLFFGLFIAWMAVTGLIIHVNDLTKGDGDRPRAIAVASAAPAGPARASADTPFVCPSDYTCRPKPKKDQMTFAGLIKHLHSGEAIGPLGTLLSILTGLALVFFSVSGIWMYSQMWINRRSRGLSPRWLWR